MADEATYGFNKPDARALVESIGMRTREYPEGRVRSSGGGGGVGAKIGLTSGSITARSGTTAGSGTVIEYKLASGTLTTNTATFTAYNLTAKAISTGHYVMCVQEQISNQWIVQTPGIVDLRLSGNNLQYTTDGVNWTTWTTATTCT